MKSACFYLCLLLKIILVFSKCVNKSGHELNAVKTCDGINSDETFELSARLNISCPSIVSSRITVKCLKENMEVSCERNIQPGTRAVYSCRDFFKPEFSQKLFNNESVCQENGVWSRDILRCEPECGRTNQVMPLVVNGLKTTTPFPWHGTMYVQINGNYTLWCGSSLISEVLFVTAAHCVHNLLAQSIKIALGKFKRSFEIHPEEHQAAFYDVKRIIQHPLYLDQVGNYGSDIAILEIHGFVELNEYRMPVCIDWQLDDLTLHLVENITGVVMGMGLTENDTFSENLRYTWLPVISNEKCIEKHKIDFRKYITVTSFCAGWANGTGVCNGDSGGGLVFPNNEVGRWSLQGIVSLSPRRQTSSFCDPHEYTIFTKVGMYVKWIQQVIEEVHASRQEK